MVERDEGYGVGLAELMNPDVARSPQPIYAMLHASTPIFRKSRESLLGRIKDFHVLPFSFREWLHFRVV